LILKFNDYPILVSVKNLCKPQTSLLSRDTPQVFTVPKLTPAWVDPNK